MPHQILLVVICNQHYNKSWLEENAETVKKGKKSEPRKMRYNKEMMLKEPRMLLDLGFAGYLRFTYTSYPGEGSRAHLTGDQQLQFHCLTYIQVQPCIAVTQSLLITFLFYYLYPSSASRSLPIHLTTLYL